MIATRPNGCAAKNAEPGVSVRNAQLLNNHAYSGADHSRKSFNISCIESWTPFCWWFWYRKLGNCVFKRFWQEGRNLQRKDLRPRKCRRRIPDYRTAICRYRYCCFHEALCSCLHFFKPGYVWCVVQNLSSKIFHMDGIEAGRQAASILHPTNLQCFKTIVHALAIAKVPVHWSFMICPPLLNFSTVYFILPTVFCSSRSAGRLSEEVLFFARTFDIWAAEFQGPWWRTDSSPVVFIRTT